MSRRTESDRKYRRALAVGIGVSVLAHALLFAYGRLGLHTFGEESPRALQFVQLPEEDTPPDRPLEVVQIRQIAATEAGGSPAASAPELAAVPAIPRLAAALASAFPRPTVYLQRVDEPEEREDPAVTYTSVADFLVQMSPDPKPLRAIDDRPVEVLARIGGGLGTGTGVGIGGGHCPPPSPRFTRSSVTPRVISSQLSGL